MRNVPISFGLMTYQSASLPWSAQRLINWYPETAPQESQTKTPFVLLPRPGTVELITISGKCRANHTIGNKLYSVFGNTVYQIDETYAATAIGTVASEGPVYISDNADQLTIVVAPYAWVYTFATSVYVQVSDTDFGTSSSVASLNSFFIHATDDLSGEFHVSDVADGLQFGALSFANAEMNSDALLRVFVDHGELWLFGSKGTEIWVPSGTTDFPFVRSTNAGPERGILAPNSVAKLDNTICWVGDDGIVYRSAGYTPNAISTRPIELMIAELDEPENIYGSSYTQNGHPFYVLNAEDELTIVYDASTNLWHERATYTKNDWRYVYPIKFNGEIVCGGIDGNLYSLRPDTYTEDGGIIRFETISPAVHANGQRITMSRLEVLFETGVGLTTGQGSDPQAMLQWSDDGGRTWSNEHWRTMGAIGAYKTRVVWRNLGQFFSRVFRLAVTDPVKPVLLGAYADYDVTPC